MVINKNYQNDTEKNELLFSLGLSSDNLNWKKGLCEATSSAETSDYAIGYKKDYTLVLNIQELSIDEDVMFNLSKENDILVFIIGDTSDVYVLIYTKKGEVVRRYVYCQWEIDSDEWEKLKWEDEDDLSSGIFDVIYNFSNISINWDDLDELEVELYQK